MDEMNGGVRFGELYRYSTIIDSVEPRTKKKYHSLLIFTVFSRQNERMGWLS